MSYKEKLRLFTHGPYCDGDARFAEAASLFDGTEWKEFLTDVGRCANYISNYFVLDYWVMDWPEEALHSLRELDRPTLTKMAKALDGVIAEAVDRKDGRFLEGMFMLARAAVEATPPVPIDVKPVIQVANEAAFSEKVRDSACYLLLKAPMEMTPDDFWDSLPLESGSSVGWIKILSHIQRGKYKEALLLWPKAEEINSEHKNILLDPVGEAIQALLVSPEGHGIHEESKKALGETRATIVADMIEKMFIGPKCPGKRGFAQGSLKKLSQ